MDKLIFLDFYWGIVLFAVGALCIRALINLKPPRVGKTAWLSGTLSLCIAVCAVAGFVIILKGPGSSQPKLAQTILNDNRNPAWLTTFKCLPAGFCRGTIHLANGESVDLDGQNLTSNIVGAFKYSVKNGEPSIAIHWRLDLLEMPLAAFMVRKLAEEYVEKVVKTDPRFKIKDNQTIELDSSNGGLSAKSAVESERQRIIDTYK